MSDISYERREGVAFATINRPEVLNAFRHQTYYELHQIVQDFVNDDASRVLILSGAGRAFSAGQDLNDLPGSTPNELAGLKEHLLETQEITRLLYHSDKVSIAAINGLAIGAGIEIALSCTMRIAAENSYFQFAEAKRGLFQTNGALYLLPRIVGLGRANHMLLTGEKISAQEALMAGLITRKVSAAELLATAERLAAKILQASDHSIRLILQGLRLALEENIEDVLEYEIQSNIALIEADGHLAGIKKFVDQHKKESDL